MDEQAREALNALADWCQKYGVVIDARVILIADCVSDSPIGVNCMSISAIEALREFSE